MNEIKLVLISIFVLLAIVIFLIFRIEFTSAFGIFTGKRIVYNCQFDKDGKLVGGDYLIFRNTFGSEQKIFIPGTKNTEILNDQIKNTAKWLKPGDVPV